MNSKTHSTLSTFILLLLALIAFAGNSLLNRAALSGNVEADWASFTAIRIISGACFLWVIMGLKNRDISAALPHVSNIIPALALFAYAAAFSYAYASLGAGVGALILFASVQFTLQGIGIAAGHVPSWIQISGLGLAFTGLIIFLFPNGVSSLTNIAWIGYILMMIAGVAWGIYSWIGRSSTSPALATARNFIGAMPFCLILLPFITPSETTAYGVFLAMSSGILTSALGYIIWYAVLPKISVSIAATAQLSVPAIAAIGGILFLDEALTKPLLLGSALIFAGIGLTIWKKG